MPAKIIVFEGLDCSFKETNAKLLKNNLEKQGFTVHLFSFPNYESDSSLFVNKYIKGELGIGKDSNPYFVSNLFSNDRYITYMRSIKDIYEQGTDRDIIIFDRYVYSNLYQLAHLVSDKFEYNYHRYDNVNYINDKDNLRIPHKDLKKINSFIQYLRDLEFVKYGLPMYDVLIYMNTPYEFAKSIIKEKNSSDDVYENNLNMLKKVYSLHSFIYHNILTDSVIIDTVHNGKLRDKEEIAKEIFTRSSFYIMM